MWFEVRLISISLWTVGLDLVRLEQFFRHLVCTVRVMIDIGSEQMDQISRKMNRIGFQSSVNEA